MVVSPVEKDTDPEVPELVVPVLNVTAPLTPLSAAFMVWIKMAPLVDVSPHPDTTRTSPPVPFVEETDSPAAM
jgi:hypothetical protein